MLEKLLNGLEALGIDLSLETAKKEEAFLQELLRWNKKINLTSINNYTEAQEKHLIDSLVLVNYLPQKGRLLDMGSGGGLPAIPLSIACPQLQITSVDSVGKKITFQKHIKRLLKLDNLDPFCARLEDITSEAGYDFIVARALSNISQLAIFARPLLAKDGRLLVMKGPEGKKELELYLSDNVENDYRLVDQYEYCLPFSRSERHLFILKKQ